MQPQPQSRRDEGVEHTTAVVTAATADHFALRTRTRGVSARRAASCLVMPAPGDKVLVALTEDDAYVLAVLERGDGPLDVRVTGDATIVVDGELSLSAKRGLDVASGEKVSLLAGRLDIKAIDAGVAVERLSVFGKYVQGEVERIKLLGDSLDTVFERLSQRVARSFRTVTEIEQVRAENVDMRANKTMNLHGDNTVMTAKKLVKLDGDQIHVG